MSNTGKLGADLLKDLADKISAKVIELANLKAETALQIGEDVAGVIADDWGGQSLYIPMNLGSKRATRNAQIYKEFTGDNHQELARKYGLSDSFIYRILKDEIERRRTPQGSLF